jgi:hypothetical protein
MKKCVFTLLCLIGMLCLLALPVLASSAKGTTGKKGAVKAPVVKLDRVEIANYWGNLDLQKKTGTVMNLAFVYTLENPNPYKVLLDNIKFTVAFEGFELNTLTNFDPSYIPGKTTNYLRITGAFDANTAAGNLAVTSGHKLQEMKVTPPELLKKWWDGISDFTFPITVNGTATFIGPDGKAMIVPFEGTFPPKK